MLILCIYDASFNNFCVSKWHEPDQHSSSGTMVSFMLGAESLADGRGRISFCHHIPTVSGAYPPSCSVFTSAQCLYLVIKKWHFEAGHYPHPTKGLRVHGPWPAFILHMLLAWCLCKGQTSPQLHTFTLWCGKTSDCNQIFLCQKKVKSIIMGAQKINLFKIFHLLPIAIKYLVCR